MVQHRIPLLQRHGRTIQRRQRCIANGRYVRIQRRLSTTVKVTPIRQRIGSADPYTEKLFLNMGLAYLPTKKQTFLVDLKCFSPMMASKHCLCLNIPSSNIVYISRSDRQAMFSENLNITGFKVVPLQ
jgi:hypothetical protein